jgi:hypothetical protein
MPEFVMNPRFTGKAYEAEKGWDWELLLKLHADDDEPMLFRSACFYKSRRIALAGMKKAIREVLETIEKSLKAQGYKNVKFEDKYFDLKANEFRTWTDEN